MDIHIRRWGGVLGSLVLVVLAVAWAGEMRAPAAASDRADGTASRIQQGYAISPVALDVAGKNRADAGLGSYLVNAVGGCNDCHSCPSYAEGVEHNPYIGGDGAFNDTAYLAGGVPFALGPGLTVVSANLTPDAAGRPAGLTFDEFRDRIRTGHDPDAPGGILQVMPWPVFRNMTDHDLRAIYTFLSSIPSAETPAPGTCQFAGQGTLPSPPGR